MRGSRGPGDSTPRTGDLGCRDARTRMKRTIPGPDFTGITNPVLAVIPVPRWLSVEDAHDEIITFGKLIQHDPACKWAVVGYDGDTGELLYVA